MDTTAPLPICLDSPARNVCIIRQIHEKKKLFFKIGDEVHIIRRKTVFNGIIRNYDGRHKMPYEILMLDGTIQRNTITNIRIGHAKSYKDSLKNKQNEPSLFIIYSSEPVVLSFD